MWYVVAGWVGVGVAGLLGCCVLGIFLAWFEDVYVCVFVFSHIIIIII